MLFVVTGPPTSGKTTYVREHAQPDDVTIDYDALAVALGSSVDHQHAPHFRAIVGKARWAAIKAALEASDNGVTVWVIDSVIPDYRMRAYTDHGAQFIRLEVDLAELHARASRERPDLWHALIDDWAPTLEAAGPAWKPNDRPTSNWGPPRRRPAYRNAAHGWRYEKLRKAFLADKTHCANCGKPFVLDAPCNHRGCLKRRGGCSYHPQYPTVQHTLHLAGPGSPPSLDVATWLAWCSGCNVSDGGRYGRARQTRARAQARETVTDLDW